MQCYHFGFLNANKMDYAIFILEKEKGYIEKCLSEWQSENYPDAKKERDKKLKSINEAITKLRTPKISEL